MPIAQQVIVLFAGANGYVDNVSVDKVNTFEKELVRFLNSSHPELEQAIAKEKTVSDDTEKRLRAAIDEFKKSSPLVEKEKPKPTRGEEPPKDGALQRARAATERDTKKGQ
jgi:F0F1-type ATP synthase alpha subunit